MKNTSSGFTLIELLVVIIIIGILSAIGLPSFLNQASKARASEAKNNLSSVMRAQQAYYTENSDFAPTFEELSLGIDKETANYKYEMAALPQIGNSEAVGVLATPIKETANAHLAVVEANIDNNNTFKTVLCEANKPGLSEFTTATLSEVRTGNLRCGKSGKRVGK